MLPRRSSCTQIMQSDEHIAPPIFNNISTPTDFVATDFIATGTNYNTQTLQIRAKKIGDWIITDAAGHPASGSWPKKTGGFMSMPPSPWSKRPPAPAFIDSGPSCCRGPGLELEEATTGGVADGEDGLWAGIGWSAQSAPWPAAAVDAGLRRRSCLPRCRLWLCFDFPVRRFSPVRQLFALL